MIVDHIKTAWKALDTLHEAAYDLPEGDRRDSTLNIMRYCKNDLAMIAHRYGLSREELAG